MQTLNAPCFSNPEDRVFVLCYKFCFLTLKLCHSQIKEMAIADKNDHNILDYSVVKHGNFSLTLTKLIWHSSCLGFRQKDNKRTR